MAGFREKIIRAGLESLFFTGAHLALRPFVGGVGVILTLHQVRPLRPQRFQPNRLLEISPRFLARVVDYLRGAGVDFVSLDEVHRRLIERDFRRRFVCMTFDDGYRDTLQYAYPILKQADVPFAIYLATSFTDRFGEMWWLALEAVIANNDRIGLMIERRSRTFDCKTVPQKRALYEELYWWLRRRPEAETRAIMRDLAARYDVDMAAFCRDLCMDWQDLAQLAADPLVTIAAHTVNHPMLATLSDKDARGEIDLSRSVIEAALQIRPAHFAYPFGDAIAAGPREFAIAADLGLKTASTTRPGVIFPKHAAQMTALPRISLNGEYQQLRYVRVLLSGAATAIWNRFRRYEAA